MSLCILGLRSRDCGRSRAAAHLIGAALIVGISASWADAGQQESSNLSDGGPPSSAAVRCLLITGEDYPGHKWQETAPVLVEALSQGGKIRVEVLDKLAEMERVDWSRYDTVVMHFKNYDPKVPGRAAFDGLDRFVKNGGGLVLVHFACGAFQEFKDDFEKLAGRVWDPSLRGHDPHGAFRVVIVDPEHPVTKGLKDFETVDELYTCLSGETSIHVLAQAVSRVDGRVYPIAFTLNAGKGRVFHCVLGHDVQALRNSHVQELYRRACLWTAGR
ncbi:MAG: ThuA domain-containing protein [Thermogutta sp.]|nr:ThuA domain-containing protein [Thermogutta sp.]